MSTNQNMFEITSIQHFKNNYSQKMKFSNVTNEQKRAPFTDTSAYPVNYQTGRIKMEVTDIDLPLGAVKFVHWRRYDNLSEYHKDGQNGFGWSIKSFPKLTESVSGNIIVEFFNGKKIRFFFDKQGKSIVTDNCSDTICLDPTNNVYIVNRADQTLWTFSAKESNDVPQGSPISITDSVGNSTRFFYNTNGNLWKVQAYHTDNPQKVLAELEYKFTQEKRIYSIIQRLFDNLKNKLVAVKRVIYNYFAKNEAFGNPGDLKAVIREIGDGKQWADDGSYYYRYYKENEVHGNKHKLKFAVNPTDYTIMTEKLKSAEIFQLDEQALLSFATKYYEYDSRGRVVKEIVEHGSRTITLEYTAFPKSGDINDVCQKTVEKHLNGFTNIIYLNNRGYTLLKETLPPDGVEEQSLVYWRVFDGYGRVIRHYHPESIRNYKLVEGSTCKLDVDLVPDEGMVQVNEYYENDPSNKIKKRLIRRGAKGPSIVLAHWEREKIDGKIVNHPIAKTEFVDDIGKKAITTRFAMEFHSNSKKLKQKTLLLPVIPESENGDGQQALQVEVFDSNNRIIWSKNELGVISHYVYDTISKRLIRQIEDVDTTKTGDFGTPLPEDWKTPDEAGKHDITDYFYNFKGRLVKTIRPENEGIDNTGKLVRCRPVSWTIYDDLHRTQHSASGYLEIDDAGNILRTVFANPVSITIQNTDGHVTDQIQACRKNLEGELLPTDKFEQDSYISWTKYVYRFGNLIAMRQYHEIPQSGEGLKDTHYAETLYDYDLQGRQIRTVSPLGAVSRTVYDSAGNAVQQWIGTNDTGATENDPHSSSPANDMLLVSETEYGHSTSCSSCGGGSSDRVLVQFQHVGEGKIRATEFKYDWRGRQTHTLDEEDENGNYIQTIRHYDNLDRVVKMEKYLCREKLNEKKSQKKTSKTNRT